ncbi:ferrous iron transport protein B [Methanohalobium sp.]|uniref:ferrous iron transport protein B n=1 Tax=Methanohalobium sp. TaxID=2837493 RepID=UPI0025EC633F|nr:ferrous iron transport protein B [Methanohalobium sp.]
MKSLLNAKPQTCCSTHNNISSSSDRIVLVGSPNVGKSVIFNALSDSYAIASNYPGTTVEISKGDGIIGNKKYEIIDTPGSYSLLPITEEERVAQRLFFEKASIYLHVIDAKNLRRMLPHTLQLIEAGKPLILVLNMMDESAERGIRIDAQKLEKMLKIPVIPAVSNKGEGIEELKKTIPEYSSNPQDFTIKYNDDIENAIKDIESNLKENYEVSKRSISQLLLQRDQVAFERTHEKCEDVDAIKDIVSNTENKFNSPINYVMTVERQQLTNSIVNSVMKIKEPYSYNNSKAKESEKYKDNYPNLKKRLDHLVSNPLTGIPILFLVLYFGLYQFVGVFAAGTVVDFLEGVVFGEHLIPWITQNFNSLVPYPLIQSLIVGDYGIVNLALTYAIALILPIVGAFFFVFSIIEDSGYLPRLAMLIDRVFKKIGLSGRAVIPLVLGFGCGTMATMVTRTLEKPREKILTTLLLSLAIPCSAQLGVILGIMSAKPAALLLWVVVMILEFLFIGYIAAKVLPGEKPSFFLEIPSLKVPKLSNVLIKTYSRMQWYFLEVMPLFIIASILIWLGKITGIFGLIIELLKYPTQWIGLPSEAADVFLLGFFRRDFGAAGLYELNKTGVMNGVDMLVAAVTLTLFMPCIAQFMMTLKERGLKIALSMAAFIFPFAFFVGFVVNYIMKILGVTL